MLSNVNYIPAMRDIPPVSVYMQEIFPARRDISPCGNGVKISRGMKLSCISKLKFVCASIGSQGIPATRDISATRDIRQGRTMHKGS